VEYSKKAVWILCCKQIRMVPIPKGPHYPSGEPDRYIDTAISLHWGVLTMLQASYVDSLLMITTFQ
jgi:hypothetical protein